MDDLVVDDFVLDHVERAHKYSAKVMDDKQSTRYCSETPTASAKDKTKWILNLGCANTIIGRAEPKQYHNVWCPVLQQYSIPCTVHGDCGAHIVPRFFGKQTMESNFGLGHSAWAIESAFDVPATESLRSVCLSGASNFWTEE